MKKNNYELCGDIEQTGSFVNTLIWVAANYESKDINELLSSASYKTLKETFRRYPYLIDIITRDDFDGDYCSMFIESNMYGLIAECHMPHCDNFSYGTDGSPTSWSIHGGYCRMFYAYAETPAQLVKEMHRQSRKHFKEMIIKDKKKKQESAREMD